MVRGGDAGLVSQPQRNLLPRLHAVIVGLLRKLGDGEVSVLVDDRCFRAGTAEGRAGGKDELKVPVRFLVPEDPFGDLEQPPEFDHGGDAGADRRLERLFTCPAESEGTQAGLVGDAKQVIAFRKGANGAAFAFGKTALGPLHKTAPPCVGR